MGYGEGMTEGGKKGEEDELREERGQEEGRNRKKECGEGI